MKTCSHCGHKIRQKLHSYSSGNGCLTLTWREDTSEGVSTSRKVTKRDVERLLASKFEKHLADRNWLPVFINGKWVLARHVKRIGPNRLRISGHSVDYAVDTRFKNSRFSAFVEEVDLVSAFVEEVDLVTTFKVKRNGKTIDSPMLNSSIRMVIRFFLNHEEELKPYFKGHKVLVSKEI
jgi:hypothetical protein